MSNKGKNKCKRGPHGDKNSDQPWFTNRRKKTRSKSKMVKNSKKRNR